MGPCVRLLSCLHNDGTQHMMGAPPADAMVHACGEGCHHDDDDSDDKDSAAASGASSDRVPELVQAGERDDEERDDEEESDDEESEDEEEGGEGDLVFEPQHVPALQMLLGKGGRVGDVPVQVDAPGDAEEAALELTNALWNEHLLARVEVSRKT